MKVKVSTSSFFIGVNSKKSIKNQNQDYTSLCLKRNHSENNLVDIDYIENKLTNKESIKAVSLKCYYNLINFVLVV